MIFLYTEIHIHLQCEGKQRKTKHMTHRICPFKNGSAKGRKEDRKSCRKNKIQGKQLKLLIGLLISCTLFDWFAINSGLWCAEDRAWRQPWSPLTPNTHSERGRGEYQYVAVRLILASSREGHHHLIGAERGVSCNTQTIHYTLYFILFHSYTH